MKSVSAIFLAAPLVCAAQLCAPHAAMAETLPDALSTAVAESPLLRAQRAQVDALGEDHVQARSAFGPTLQIGANSTVAASTAQGENSAVALSINQPLFYSGRIANASRATKSDAEAGEERLRATKAALIGAVARAYADVQRDESLLAFADQLIALLDGQADEVAARRAVDQVTRTDVDLVRMRQAAARGARASAAGQLEASRAEYTNLVGHRPATLAPLPGVRGFPSIEAALTAAEDSSPALAAAKLDQKGARARVSAARSEYGPSVALRGNVGYEQVWQFGYQQSVRADSVAIVASLPLFTSGLNRSRVRQAQDRNTSAENLVENARRELTRDVEQAYSGAAAAHARVAAGIDRVAGSRAAYEGARIEFGAGMRTTIDVLNAAQELNAAESEAAAAQRDAFVADVLLLQSIGVLTEDSFTATTATITPASAPKTTVQRASPAMLQSLAPDAHARRDVAPTASAQVKDVLAAAPTAAKPQPRPTTVPAAPTMTPVTLAAVTMAPAASLPKSAPAPTGPPAAAPPPPAVASATPPSATGRFGIQIGAYDTAETARAALEAAKARSDALTDKTAVVQEARVNGQLWRRAVFTGFADQTEAAKACASLGDAAKGCFVRQPSTTVASRH